MRAEHPKRGLRSLVSRRAAVAAAAQSNRHLLRLARDNHVSLRTVQRDAALFKRARVDRSLSRRGRPPKITARVRARIRVKMSVKHRPSVRQLRKQLEGEGIYLSRGSVDNALHMCGFRSVHPQRKPMLTAAHKAARVAWAMAHVNDDESEFKRRVYSDEKLFIAGRHKRQVWIKVTDPIPHAPTSE